MESALHFQTPQLLDAQLSGRSARRNGNFDPSMAPHDSYPCAGEDQWCAIAVETADQWQRLCAAIGAAELAEEPALQTITGRQEHAGRIDAAIAVFTSKHAPLDAMIKLQAAGVPAGAVQRSSDHLQDPQLAHRNFFRRMNHPEMGEVPYEGHQYSIRGYDNGPRTPAPCLGEHSYEVLSEILELNDEDLTEVLVSGACG